MSNEQSPRNEVVDAPIRVFNTYADALLASPKYLGQIFVTLEGHILIPRGYGTGHLGDTVNGVSPLTGDINQPGAGAVYSSVTTGVLRANALIGSTQALIASGAVDVDGNFFTTTIATVAPIALTMADGSVGQFKNLSMITDGGDAVLTPAHFANGTNITFNDVGDNVLLQFLGGKWTLVSNFGCTIA